MFTHAFELDEAVGEGVRRVGAVIAAGGLSPVLGVERREMRISRETVMDEREIKSLRARQYLPIESYVLRPISTGLPTVRLRKGRISAGSCHGSRLPMPITRSSSMAATSAMITTSHRDRRFDCGVGVIVDQLEIFIT